jgi:hypothetical protein
MTRLALLAPLLVGCIFEDEGVAPELTNLACTPAALSSAPYHADCSVDVSDGDADTHEVTFAVHRPDNYAVASGHQDVPGTDGVYVSHATLQFSFDLPAPITAGTYTLVVDATDIDHGNGDETQLSIEVQ